MSAGVHRFDPWQVTTKTSKLVVCATPPNMQYLGDEVKTVWLGVRIMSQELGGMPTCGLLPLCASTVKIWLIVLDKYKAGSVPLVNLLV